MNVERSLKVIAAATACMGTAMLGIGEENYLLAVVAVLVSISGLILCDLTKWFCLNNTGSNIAAIAMLGLAVVQLRNSEFEQRVLIMADLLGYLQFVLQFRVKTPRNYWLLLLVSFLQTCVAAALHTGVTFAIMLTMYLFCGVFFLGYFYVYREQLRFDAEAEKAKTLIEKRGYGFSGKSVAQLPSDALGGEFSRRMSSIVVGTIGLSALFFVAVPRAGQANWTPTGISDRTVGISSEINLSRSGEIIEDPEEVMQVRFFDSKTNLPYQVDGEIYMRGLSLSRYFEGRWVRVGMRGQRDDPRIEVYQPNLIDRDVVRQTVTIEPLSTSTLFSTAPAFALAPENATTAIKFNPSTGQLSRSEAQRMRRFQYELIVPGISDHSQRTLVPLQREIEARDLRDALQMPRTADNGDPLRELKAIAASVVADLPPDNFYERAKRLEAYLRDSGRFSYTLDGAARPPGVDPLEDFMTNGPTGHCEFFAGALAMMLRSVNIPARVVLGYRSGEYNVVGNFYQFQQLHAHSWVEAYLPAENVPPGRLTAVSSIRNASQYGAWLQLDGTPGASIQQAAANESRWFELIQMGDYIRFLWSNYVVGMDSARQKEAVYAPLVETASEAWASITSRSAWAERWENIKRFFDFSDHSFERARRFALEIGIGAMLAAVLLSVARKLWRKKKLAKSKGGITAKGSAPVPEVEFYRRLENSLRAADCARQGNQTQREFAAAAGDRLSQSATSATIATLPQFIVEAFYRVRFGRQKLDPVQQAEVESALRNLDAALDARRKNG